MSKTVRKVVKVAAAAVALGVLGPLFGVGAAIGVAFRIGASLLLAADASRSAKKKAKSVGNVGFGTEIGLTGDPESVREIIYGRAWTGGTLRYRNATGTDNKEFYMVIVLAGHECDAVETTMADKETLTLDGSGNVTAPSKWVGRMNVRFYLGTDSQTADSTLDTAFANWTSNHRLRGCCYAIVKLTFDETHLNTPPSFRFLVRGRKVYDPRLDSTNGGSGAHRLATPSTWAWSENPILCHNDYWRGIMINSIRIAGPGVSSARFSWPNVIAEANVCEENVTLVGGAVNEDRYTANGIIDPRTTHGEVRNLFEQTIAGDILFCDGKWRYFAGAYRAPTLSLMADHFIGPLRITVHRSESERRDTAHGRYAALAEFGNAVSYAPMSLAAAVVGAEKVTNIDMPLVNDRTNTGGTYDGGARAQRIAKLLLERDAAGKRLTCTTNLYGLRAVPGESISVTHAAFGLSSQVMRVIDVQLRAEQQGERSGLVVDLVLEAGPSSLYTWSAEETVIGATTALLQARVPFPSYGNWNPISNGGVTRSGVNTFTKTAGTSAWDSAIWSAESYKRCAVRFKAAQTNKAFIFGINTSPTGTASYTDIEEGIYCEADGTLSSVRSSTVTALGSYTYTTSDYLEVVYDGVNARYYKNRELMATFAAANAGSAMFLDSSFFDDGAIANDVQFGPVDSVGQVQIDPEAASTHVVVEDASDDDLVFLFGPGNYGPVCATSFVVPSGETYRLSVEFQAWFVTGTGGSGGNARILVNSGQVQETQPIGHPNDAENIFRAWTYVDDFTAGTHDFDIQARCTSGGITKLHATIKITGHKR